MVEEVGTEKSLLLTKELVSNSLVLGVYFHRLLVIGHILPYIVMFDVAAQCKGDKKSLHMRCNPKIAVFCQI